MGINEKLVITATIKQRWAIDALKINVIFFTACTIHAPWMPLAMHQADTSDPSATLITVYYTVYTVVNANEWFPSPAGNPGMSLILIKLFLARNTSALRIFSLIRSGRFQEIPNSQKYSQPGRAWSVTSWDSRLLTGIPTNIFNSVLSTDSLISTAAFS